MLGCKVEKEKRNQCAKTPESFYRQLHGEFDFNFDPCPADPTVDGLAVPWGSRVFCNPPYKDVKVWLKKATSEHSLGGKLIVLLLPSRTNTKWFHKYILDYEHTPEVRFIKGKLKFQGYTKEAPFPSCVVVYRPVEKTA